MPPSSSQPKEPLFLDMPKLVIILFSILGVAQCFYMFGGDDLQNWMLRSFALANAKAAILLQPRPFGSLTPLLSHVLLHDGWGHFGANFFFGLAFSVPVLRAFGDDRRGNLLFLLLFFGSALGGALLFLLLNQGEPRMAVGASSALSGLFAAMAWVSGGQKRAVQWGGIWIVLNMLPFVFGHFLGMNIAWEAHIGGYLTGAFLYPFLMRMR